MKTSSSKLIDFYHGLAEDDNGRMLGEILSWDDKLLESIHDYIQWLFPLNERSAFNSSAPVLTDDDIEEFRKSGGLHGQLIKSFDRMLEFYGFKRENGNGKISRSETFGEKSKNWLAPENHNFLRLTRMIKSLKLLGLPQEAESLEAALENVYEENKSVIGETTIRFWKDAAR